MKYILALDQGTTSSRALIFDKSGAVVSTAQQEFMQMFPQPGWVEHNPKEIWETQLEVARRAMSSARLTRKDIAAIGITNQRETAIVWDRRSGQPICNAIVWQDRRTAAFCDKLKARGLEAWVRKKTGLVIDAYFSASKIKWILENVADARRLAGAGHLAFGTVDSWLVWNLTGGTKHLTDVSNASRTMLLNLRSAKWDPALLKMFGVPSSMLPQVTGSSEVVAHATGEFEGVPIAGIAGDQQAALFGQACTQPGMVKNTYGTGCFMLMHTGPEIYLSKKKLLTTIAWKINGKTEYALEGSIFIGGAVVQWLRDGLGIIKSATESETLATSVPDTGGVYFVPAFAGLGAPHWDPHARGLIVGLTRGTNPRHIARAGLESIAFQTADLLQAMESDSGIRLRELRVDGGASNNDFLMQFQAGLLNVEVVRPQITETTALGAAYLAGLAVGFWKNQAEIRSQWSEEQRFKPAMRADQRKKLLAGWSNAVSCAKVWARKR